MDKRVLLNDNPLSPSNAAFKNFKETFQTRPAWITPYHAALPPQVTAYRLRFDLPHKALIRVHVSADERYQFFVDGARIGRGPERGSDRIWFYESYDLDLPAGQHTLVAIVWQLGNMAPRAQVSLAAGFLLEAEGPFEQLISTKSAAWETRPVSGIDFSMPAFSTLQTAWFVEPIQTTHGASYSWGIEMGEGDGWEIAKKRVEDSAAPWGIQALHVLYPASLPAQLALPRAAGRVRFVAEGTWSDVEMVTVESDACLQPEMLIWQAVLDGVAPVVLPPHTRRQVIIDLQDYVCAYPQVYLSGGKGSRLIIGWAEALYLDVSSQEKGQRDQVEGRTFVSLCRDIIQSDGGTQRRYEPLWWRAGRYIELLIETEDEPLRLDALHLLETRYPLEMHSRFSSSDARLEQVIPVALRGLQMCAHETFMDCPYYEQLMYVGDSRLEALTTFVISADERLPRKAVSLFGASRLPDGLTQARYPSRDIQVIPPFSLWWIGMLYDYALWRGDRTFVAGLLPCMRGILDGFLRYLQSDNLLKAPDGWNFSDWIADWPLGVPPQGFDGFSGLLNWHLVYTLGLATRLEQWVGDPLLAQRWHNCRQTVAAAVRTAFWNEQRGMFADDLAHENYSEHTQCLALLSGLLAGEQYSRTAENLLHDSSLTRTTIYFNHYLFETFRLLEQPTAFFERMGLWFDLPAQGFKTTPEQPEPSRSDCHGWGAHPLYHFFASLLGIRPASFGFESVEIAPMPGHLSDLSGEMVHPLGQIEVDLQFKDGHVRGNISLPPGLTGVFRFAGKKLDLQSGQQQVAC
ncbi:MAG: alpha-L-rhamnosidase C-terminal domain-containing protein [Anaerolineales bacterium]